MEKIYDLEWKEKYIDGVKHMEEIIGGEEFSDLHVLDMFYCEIGVDGANYLKEMLLSKPIESLQELNLSGNALTDDGFIAIMDILIAGALPNLIYINVDDNKLTVKSIQYLKKVYESKKCDKLQAVSLNLNDLGEEGALALAEVIDISPLPWLKLNLNENHIGSTGFDRIMDVIEKREFNLNEFSVSQCGLSQDNIARVGKVLGTGKWSNLLSLDMSCMQQ